MGPSGKTDYGEAELVTEGPFAGWLTWSLGRDPFETYAGGFYYRVEADGAAVSGFDPQPHHLNSAGALHGGCLMSFADFAIFSIAYNRLDGSVLNAVTLTLNCEFVGAGDLSGRLLARGDVLRETRGLVFARGLITQGERTLLSFSGTLRKLKNSS
ncbi:MAG: PaaI family thioesterase [Hyphomonadaceae bacterium]